MTGRPQLHPYDYPWRPADRPMLIDARGVIDDDPPVPPPDAAERVLVVAVGSNRSPEVLAAKLAGVAGVLTVAPAVVGGLGVGHSARISRRGYLAATPFADPAGRAQVSLLWLTADQASAIDATEPNYQRVELDPATYPVEWSGGARVPAVGGLSIYRSRWGLLAPGGTIMRLGSQNDVQQLLLADESLLTAWPPGAVPGPALCDLLATDDVRRRVNAQLVRSIGTAPDGLRLSREPG